MVKNLIKLANNLDINGYHKQANLIDKLITIATAKNTRCIAILKYPIKFTDGSKTEMFNYKSYSCNQIISAIPIILSKKHPRVWFLEKKYELPAQSRLLASRLAEEKMLGNIECECYIDE